MTVSNLYTLSHAAELSGIDRRIIAARVRKGVLPTVKVGRYHHLTGEQLRALRRESGKLVTKSAPRRSHLLARLIDTPLLTVITDILVTALLTYNALKH